MSLTVEVAWIVAVLLVATRMAALFLFAPVFASIQLPTHFRVLIVLALAATLVGSLHVAPASMPTTLNGLIGALTSELVLGGALAFGLLAAFGAFMLAGRLVDLQVGFSVANLIDPSTRRQAPLLGVFLNLLAVMLFFTIDGHHMLIRGLAFSLERIPPGAPIGQLDIAAVVSQFGAMFVYALVIVAPVIFVLLLLDIGMAVMARTMPQMNAFIVSIPLKIFVGLSVLAVSLNYVMPVAQKLFESVFQYWQHIITSVHG